MIRKYFTLLLLFNCVMQYCSAQDGNKKLRLQSISSVGLLNGYSGPSLALQTILGGYYQHSFLGVGVGLDYYRYRSIPLFVDMRHEFGKGKRSLFLYGDIGYNYECVAKRKMKESFTYTLQHRFYGGSYYDAGLGYKVGFNKSNALLLSAGYTFKKLQSEVGSGVCPFIGPCYNAVQTYRYYLSRLVIKAGWVL
jgi:hypothetical protein